MQKEIVYNIEDLHSQEHFQISSKNEYKVGEIIELRINPNDAYMRECRIVNYHKK